MVWNGRNESILGAKAEGDDASSSTEVTGDVFKKTGDGSDANKKAPPAPAPIMPSVWNGRHQKIMANKEAVSDASSVASSVAGLARSPSPASSSAASSVSKGRDPGLIVISPVDAKSKEDETTNSTAGSSITKSIDNEESDNVDVKVVTTNVVTAVSAAESEKDKQSGATEVAVSSPTMRKSGSNASLNNRQKNKANNFNVRRTGINGKGGARGSNNNGNNNAVNNNSRSNYARGGSSGGSGRRRTNNVEKPVCSFFMRGMCNRGTSCAFRHDPAHAPSASCVAASSGNVPIRRSGSYPQAESRNVLPYLSNKRAFDPHKALAIKMAKEAQDKEDRSSFASPSAKVDSKIIKDEKKTDDALMHVDPLFFSIDVECIATGYGSCAKGINDGCGNAGRDREGVPANQFNEQSQRYPGRVAMVDSSGAVLANILIRPPQDGAGVVSYLTPLTGLSAELCLGEDAKPLEEAVGTIKGLLPPDSVLVGQAIDHDVEWLGLVPGRDFGRMVDISEIFRQRMPSSLGQAANILKEREKGGAESPASEDPSSDACLGFPTRYRHFSLRHVCVNLLDEDIQNGVHDPIVDARYSLLLFHKYRNSSVTQLRIVRDGLHRAPITPSFASGGTPVVDGVCVSAAAYPYKRAARKIWWWYSSRRRMTEQNLS